MGRQNQVVELLAFTGGPHGVEGQRSRARQGFRGHARPLARGRPHPARAPHEAELSWFPPYWWLRLIGDWAPSPSIPLWFPIWGAEVCLHDCLDRTLSALRLRRSSCYCPPWDCLGFTVLSYLWLSPELPPSSVPHSVFYGPFHADVKMQHSLVGHPYSLGG